MEKWSHIISLSSRRVENGQRLLEAAFWLKHTHQDHGKPVGGECPIRATSGYDAHDRQEAGQNFNPFIGWWYPWPHYREKPILTKDQGRYERR